MRRRKIWNTSMLRLLIHAEREIDMAAYVLTDWPILQALTRAADRGVHNLDGTQLAEREPAKVLQGGTHPNLKLV
jgi:phosphatidylserine/phosphatidylglycerophosphate/cardiolipin synthase-like enzyme